MRRLALTLLAVSIGLLGCESDSKSSSGLTPVLDSEGQAVTNASGEPLFTDSNGNTGTEAELTSDPAVPQGQSGSSDYDGGVTTTTGGGSFEDTGETSGGTEDSGETSGGNTGDVPIGDGVSVGLPP